MTRQEAINYAKTSILLSMTRLLDSSNVQNSIASFASDFFGDCPERDLDRINSGIDSLIDKLNTFKNLVNTEKQLILNADGVADYDDIHDSNK